MMKNSKVFTLSTLMIIICWSCSTKTESTESQIEETADEWKGMDEFHMIMAESFHPYRDSANLAPAKQFAGELVSLANQWMDQDLPEKVNNNEVKNLLNDLKTGTAELANLVEAGDDAAIGDALTSVHDVFHHLQESWYKKEEK